MSGFVAILFGILFWVSQEDVSDKTFLEIDFSNGLVEYVPDDPGSRMMLAKRPQVIDVVEALQNASDDDRISGIVARLSHMRMGMACIQEVRNAVLAFRKSGKPAIAYADTFGEFSPGTGSYYLATAFEKIYLQPSGDICLTGLLLETQFLKGTFEKLGVVPRIDRRHEYKNAVNTFTEETYTEPHKEALTRITDSIFGQIVKGIAQARDISEENVRGLVDHGLFLGQEAVNAKLVDGLAYRDAVYEEIKSAVGDQVKFLSLWDYLEEAGRFYADGETLALIYGVGGIQRGRSQYNPLFGDAAMGSGTLTKAFRSAIADEDVKAILFRVNSPGGSYVASDSIWRETVRAKAAGKPVIVSMGNVAGSGGYFVSMAADKIIAQPGTITGSIGVFAGKMLTSGFWEKMGISWDEVHAGSNATIWTGIRDYTPEQWSRLQDTLDRIYADFTTKAAKGREMPLEKVMNAARGRVWTGEDAKSLGLIDELGGFPEAIALAKAAAGIPEDRKVSLKLFPEKKPLIEVLLEKGEMSEEANISFAAMAQTLETIRPLLRSLRQAGLLGDAGLLSMQNPWVHH